MCLEATSDASEPAQTMPDCTLAATESFGDGLLRQSGLMQLHQACSLSRAEPWMPHELAGLADQPRDRRLGEAVAASEFGCGGPSRILGHQALDRVSLQPLRDAPSVTTVSAP
jgi:hypothetical protein